MGIIKKILRMRTILIIWMTVCHVLGFTASSRSENFRLEATVDNNKVAMGSVAQLTLTIYGITGNSPVPPMPTIDGFEVHYLGPSTRISIVNGQYSSSVSYVYSLFPVKEGQFQIPPISVDIDGKTYTSAVIPMEIMASGSSPSANTDQASPPMPSTEKLEDRIFLVVNAPKKKFFVGEKVPLTMKLYVKDLSVKDIQFPQFERQGFTIDEFAQPKQYQETLGGVLYNVVEFDASLYPQQAGALNFGPAQLSCSLLYKSSQNRRPSGFDNFMDDPFFDNFFTTYQKMPYTVKSPSLSLEVQPLPETGKPSNFSGAIGQYQFDVTIGPTEVKEGDPITLKLEVSGDGNLNGIDLPTLKASESFKTYEPQIKITGNVKTAEEVLIPPSMNAHEIPAIDFSYFDPQSGTYQTITRGPFPIKVKKAEGESFKIVEKSPVGQTVQQESLGRDIVFIKDSQDDLRPLHSDLYKKKRFYLVVLFSFLAFIFLFYFTAQHQRLQTDFVYARRLHAALKAREELKNCAEMLDDHDDKKFYDTVHKALLGYFADKLHLSPGMLTLEIIGTSLSSIIDARWLEDTKKIFEDCDAVRFASAKFDKSHKEEILRKALEIINKIERTVA